MGRVEITSAAASVAFWIKRQAPCTATWHFPRNRRKRSNMAKRP